MRHLLSLASGAYRWRSLRAMRLHLATADIHTADSGIPFLAPGPGDDEHAKTVRHGLQDCFGTVRGCQKRYMSETVRRTSKQIAVSERNLQSAAVRLLPKSNKLVSTEVDYLRRVLGDKATQVEIDEKVVLVRRLPWREIVGE